MPALHHVVNLCACYNSAFLWSPDVYQEKEVFSIIISLIIMPCSALTLTFKNVYPAAVLTYPHLSQFALQ